MAKTLIIGGVAGGATTATRLRRLDEQMEIVLLERGDYISYANCGLPYYIGDVIKESFAQESMSCPTGRQRERKYVSSAAAVSGHGMRREPLQAMDLPMCLYSKAASVFTGRSWRRVKTHHLKIWPKVKR